MCRKPAPDHFRDVQLQARFVDIDPHHGAVGSVIDDDTRRNFAALHTWLHCEFDIKGVGGHDTDRMRVDDS